MQVEHRVALGCHDVTQSAATHSVSCAGVCRARHQLPLLRLAGAHACAPMSWTHLYARLAPHEHRQIFAEVQSGTSRCFAACSRRSCGPSLLMLLPLRCTRPAEQHSTEFCIPSYCSYNVSCTGDDYQVSAGLDRYIAHAIERMTMRSSVGLQWR